MTVADDVSESFASRIICYRAACLVYMIKQLWVSASRFLTLDFAKEFR